MEALQRAKHLQCLAMHLRLGRRSRKFSGTTRTNFFFLRPPDTFSSSPPPPSNPPRSRGCCAPADPADKRGFLPDRQRKCRDCFGCLLFLVFCACARLFLRSLRRPTRSKSRAPPFHPTLTPYPLYHSPSLLQCALRGGNDCHRRPGHSVRKDQLPECVFQHPTPPGVGCAAAQTPPPPLPGQL